MLRRLKLIVAYDGTAYRGWQKTATGPSIEAVLEEAIFQITRERSTLLAASRTDAGVHALGQVVVFDTQKSIPPDRLRLGINACMPPDIRVLEVQEVPPNFHPTLDNQGKEYHYSLSVVRVQPPHLRHYAWHCHYDLNFAAMQEAAAHFVGTYDFSAFCNAREDLVGRDRVRTIDRVALSVEGDLVRIEMVGNSFLFRMARNIAGTLVSVGRGKLLPDVLPDILRGRDRTLAGMTAPAHGLSLIRVIF